MNLNKFDEAVGYTIRLIIQMLIIAIFVLALFGTLVFIPLSGICICELILAGKIFHPIALAFVWASSSAFAIYSFFSTWQELK